MSKLVVNLLTNIDAIHKTGYVHLDIKPGNIVKLPNGSFHIVDFGSAIHQRSTNRISNPGQYTKKYVARERQGYILGDITNKRARPRYDWESAFYSVLDVSGCSLPWANQTCDQKVLESKDSFMKNLAFGSSTLPHWIQLTTQPLLHNIYTEGRKRRRTMRTV